MFAKKSVDAILASFKKNIDELRALASAKISEAHDATAEAERQTEIARLADTEAGRAFAVANKIEALIG